MWYVHHSLFGDRMKQTREGAHPTMITLTPDQQEKVKGLVGSIGEIRESNGKKFVQCPHGEESMTEVVEITRVRGIEGIHALGKCARCNKLYIQRGLQNRGPVSN